MSEAGRPGDASPGGLRRERAAEETIERTPGIVLSVNEDLRMLAWSRAAQQELAILAGGTHERQCYEIVSATDAETGRPCNESCPLARGADRPGWAHSRILEIEHAGTRKRLNCFQLKYVTPGGERSNLCFLGPSGPSDDETQSRVLQAIESVYPMASGIADIKEVLEVSLAAVLRTTSADGAEVFLLDPKGGEPILTESRGFSAETMEAFRRSVVGDRPFEPIFDTQLPLLATATASGAASGTYICAPLAAEGRVLGGLGIASRRRDFDIALATRILFPVAAQLGVYLRWAYLPGLRAEKAPDKGPGGQSARLRVHCHGAFRLVMDGNPIPLSRFRRLKALTLLKFLVAHRGRPVPRESLMELLWPEADPVRAGANLRVVLHSLRRGLEPDLSKGEASSFVFTRGDLVYLAPSGVIWVDGEEFVQRARHATRLAAENRNEEAVVEYRRAVTLYVGDYMEDEPYSDWCLFEREHLKEVYINLHKQMASVLTEMGDVDEAVKSYRAALDIDHAREEVHRRLIRLLLQNGRRDEAVRQYETCRRVLREELGVEPTRETESTYREMLAQTSR